MQPGEIDHPFARYLALDQVNRDALLLGADHTDDFCGHGCFLSSCLARPHSQISGETLAEQETSKKRITGAGRFSFPLGMRVARETLKILADRQ